MQRTDPLGSEGFKNQVRLLSPGDQHQHQEGEPPSGFEDRRGLPPGKLRDWETKSLLLKGSFTNSLSATGQWQKCEKHLGRNEADTLTGLGACARGLEPLGTFSREGGTGMCHFLGLLCFALLPPSWHHIGGDQFWHSPLASLLFASPYCPSEDLPSPSLSC